SGSEGRHPIEDLQNLRREIDLYDPRLSERPWYIIANKMDLPNASENLRMLQERFPDREIIAISAHRSEGIDELQLHLDRWLQMKRKEAAGTKKAQTTGALTSE
ncbi:MAG TPA: hypothetical protein VIJ87_09525, partial [Pyrinomonadaceae bacterium]